MEKILFITPHLKGGGAERVILSLANEFSEIEDIDTTLMVNNFTGPYIKDIKHSLRTHILNKEIKVNPSLLITLRSMIKEINKIKPTVIMTTLTVSNLLLLAIKPFLKCNPRVVVRETNPPSAQWSGKKEKMFNVLYKLFYPRADKIIAISDAVKMDLLGYINKDKLKNKIKVIYNPIDIELIQRQAKERPDTNWINKKSKCNIISIGRLVPQKDYPTLLKAVAIVSQQIQCQLTILGEGQEYDHLVNMTKELGITEKVHFLGFVDNPYSYLKESDLFILTSKSEGFGLVIAESLALGTPVIATNCNGAPKEILDNGKYGTLVKVADAESIAKEILDYEDPATKKNKPSTRHYDFDIKKIARSYYQELISD
ncbi:glycosyltransferase involved in cell wall biosynthesis [Geomicrobium halophilum]|uniref:Glycosyltransferase involved in cell wall biosynthesis n=1 Tax=Geomicrobium halophilum TaxID=549000 RepID=A0A841PRU7_9BACL|nr:glycosyltransferase [Geomicrobium halophilum]MBB6449886.1 glycosyltransferase involved in cell wall biosynthesis [Geomicrobium halophilum]